jgi:hypothetical protein
MKRIFGHLSGIVLVCLFLFSCSKESSVGPGSSSNGTGGSLARFTIAGNYLYIVDNNKLNTYDITRPDTPVFSNTVTIGNGIETIFPYGNHLYIGSQTGMFIYSLANPAVPAYTGEAQHLRSCDPVVANDSAAFVTLRSGSACGPAIEGLYIYDTRNLMSPQLITTINLATPWGLGLKDSILYVCGGTNGMSVVNVADLQHPVMLQTIRGHDFRDVIADRNLLVGYVADGIALYDIGNPAAPAFIKKIGNE